MSLGIVLSGSYTIVRDSRILTRIEKKYGVKFDREHGCYFSDSSAIENHWKVREQLRIDGYDLKYFDGCFNPFLVRYPK